MIWLILVVALIPIFAISRMQSQIVDKYEWKRPSEPFFSSTFLVEITFVILVAMRQSLTILPALIVGSFGLYLIDKKLQKHNPPSSFLFLERAYLIYGGTLILAIFLFILPQQKSFPVG